MDPVTAVLPFKRGQLVFKPKTTYFIRPLTWLDRLKNWLRWEIGEVIAAVIAADELILLDRSAWAFNQVDGAIEKLKATCELYEPTMIRVSKNGVETHS